MSRCFMQTLNILEVKASKAAFKLQNNVQCIVLVAILRVAALNRT